MDQPLPKQSSDNNKKHSVNQAFNSFFPTNPYLTILNSTNLADPMLISLNAQSTFSKPSILYIN